MKSTARLAGFLYLLLVIFGILNLMYIPSQLIVMSDPAKTVANIVTQEQLFRVGIVCGIVAFLAFLLLPLALYKLLHKVNQHHAVLMVAFALVSVPISFVNLLQKFSVLSLLDEAATLGMDAATVQREVMYALHQYNNGIELSQVFWGLWLFPFGYLVYRSNFLPKIFGVLLMAGCAGYLIEFMGEFLFTGYSDTIISSLVGIPASLGEIGICLWLLIVGVRSKDIA
jgi:hypothetical protein